MEHEIEQLQHAKMFMDYLANGVDPVSDMDAASAIKLPTDVIILSSTPLGFHTPKSKNYRFCQEIYRILTEKECSIAESVCQGKGYELNSFVKSLAG